MAELSRRPYLLRAMHEWMIDSGYTPHLNVDATQERVQVPRAYVKEGRIVLNISPSATQALLIDATAVQFNARFGGQSQHVYVPVDAVLGVYARETGQGMVFTEETGAVAGSTDPQDGPPAPTSPPAAPAPDKARGAKSRRPSLKVVK